jgi:hypothetical protein
VDRAGLSSLALAPEASLDADDGAIAPQAEGASSSG